MDFHAVEAGCQRVLRRLAVVLDDAGQLGCFQCARRDEGLQPW